MYRRSIYRSIKVTENSQNRTNHNVRLNQTICHFTCIFNLFLRSSGQSNSSFCALGQTLHRTLEIVVMKGYLNQTFHEKTITQSSLLGQYSERSFKMTCRYQWSKQGGQMKVDGPLAHLQYERKCTAQKVKASLSVSPFPLMKNSDTKTVMLLKFFTW